MDTMAHAEAVESGLDALIEKRHERRVKAEGERDEEALWMASVRRYEDRLHRERLWERLRYHDGQARRLSVTLEALVARHRSEVGRCEAMLGIGAPGGYPLMARCGFIKASGERCKGTATGPHGLCWAHAPENAEKRRRMASKAARAKPNRELASVKAQLQDLTTDVLSGELETGRAAVANQLINTRLRAIELERKIREADELEARIEALESKSGGGRRWGA